MPAARLAWTSRIVVAQVEAFGRRDVHGVAGRKQRLWMGFGMRGVSAADDAREAIARPAPASVVRRNAPVYW